MLKKKDRKLIVYSLLLWVGGLFIQNFQIFKETSSRSPFVLFMKDKLKLTQIADVQMGKAQFQNQFINKPLSIQPDYKKQLTKAKIFSESKVFFEVKKTYKKSKKSKKSKRQRKKSKTTELAKKFNVNIASKQELISIKGIGPVLAQRIIERQKGPNSFKTGADLMKVKGLGNKKLQLILQSVKFK